MGDRVQHNFKAVKDLVRDQKDEHFGVIQEEVAASREDEDREDLGSGQTPGKFYSKQNEDGSLELSLALSVDTDKDPETGMAVVKDVFTYDADGNFQTFKRICAPYKKGEDFSDSLQGFIDACKAGGDPEDSASFAEQLYEIAEPLLTEVEEEAPEDTVEQKTNPEGKKKSGSQGKEKPKKTKTSDNTPQVNTTPWQALKDNETLIPVLKEVLAGEVGKNYIGPFNDQVAQSLGESWKFHTKNPGSAVTMSVNAEGYVIIFRLAAVDENAEPAVQNSEQIHLKEYFYFNREGQYQKHERQWALSPDFQDSTLHKAALAALKAVEAQEGDEDLMKAAGLALWKVLEKPALPAPPEDPQDSQEEEKDIKALGEALAFIPKSFGQLLDSLDVTKHTESSQSVEQDTPEALAQRRLDGLAYLESYLREYSALKASKAASWSSWFRRDSGFDKSGFDSAVRILFGSKDEYDHNIEGKLQALLRKESRLSIEDALHKIVEQEKARSEGKSAHLVAVTESILKDPLALKLIRSIDEGSHKDFDMVQLALGDIHRKGFASTAQKIAKGYEKHKKYGEDAAQFVRFSEGGFEAAYSLPQLKKQLFNKGSLAGMAAAPLLGAATEGWFLSRAKTLADAGKAVGSYRWIAPAAGIVAEAGAFTSIHNVGESFSHDPRQIWSYAGQNLGSTALMFGLTRLAHGQTARSTAKRLNRSYKPGRPIEPFYLETTSGRILTSEMPAMQKLSPLAKWRYRAEHHISGIGAMYAANMMSVHMPYLSDLLRMPHMLYGDEEVGWSWRAVGYAATSYAQAWMGYRIMNGLTLGGAQAAVARVKTENVKNESATRSGRLLRYQDFYRGLQQRNFEIRRDLGFIDVAYPGHLEGEVEAMPGRLNDAISKVWGKRARALKGEMGYSRFETITVNAGDILPGIESRRGEPLKDSIPLTFRRISAEDGSVRYKYVQGPDNNAKVIDPRMSRLSILLAKAKDSGIRDIEGIPALEIRKTIDEITELTKSSGESFSSNSEAQGKVKRMLEEAYQQVKLHVQGGKLEGNFNPELVTPDVVDVIADLRFLARGIQVKDGSGMKLLSEVADIPGSTLNLIIGASGALSSTLPNLGRVRQLGQSGTLLDRAIDSSGGGVADKNFSIKTRKVSEERKALILQLEGGDKLEVNGQVVPEGRVLLKDSVKFSVDGVNYEYIAPEKSSTSPEDTRGPSADAGNEPTPPPTSPPSQAPGSFAHFLRQIPDRFRTTSIPASLLSAGEAWGSIKVSGESAQRLEKFPRIVVGESPSDLEMQGFTSVKMSGKGLASSHAFIFMAEKEGAYQLFIASAQEGANIRVGGKQIEAKGSHNISIVDGRLEKLELQAEDGSWVELILDVNEKIISELLSPSTSSNNDATREGVAPPLGLGADASIPQPGVTGEGVPSAEELAADEAGKKPAQAAVQPLPGSGNSRAPETLAKTGFVGAGSEPVASRPSASSPSKEAKAVAAPPGPEPILAPEPFPLAELSVGEEVPAAKPEPEATPEAEPASDAAREAEIVELLGDKPFDYLRELNERYKSLFDGNSIPVIPSKEILSRSKGKHGYRPNGDADEEIPLQRFVLRIQDQMAAKRAELDREAEVDEALTVAAPPRPATSPEVPADEPGDTDRTVAHEGVKTKAPDPRTVAPAAKKSPGASATPQEPAVEAAPEAEPAAPQAVEVVVSGEIEIEAEGEEAKTRVPPGKGRIAPEAPGDGEGSGELFPAGIEMGGEGVEAGPPVIGLDPEDAPTVAPPSARVSEPAAVPIPEKMPPPPPVVADGPVDVSGYTTRFPGLLELVSGGEEAVARWTSHSASYPGHILEAPELTPGRKLISGKASSEGEGVINFWREVASASLNPGRHGFGASEADATVPASGDAKSELVVQYGRAASALKTMLRGLPDWGDCWRITTDKTSEMKLSSFDEGEIPDRMMVISLNPGQDYSTIPALVGEIAHQTRNRSTKMEVVFPLPEVGRKDAGAPIFIGVKYNTKNDGDIFRSVNEALQSVSARQRQGILTDILLKSPLVLSHEESGEIYKGYITRVPLDKNGHSPHTWLRRIGSEVGWDPGTGKNAAAMFRKLKSISLVKPLTKAKVSPDETPPAPAGAQVPAQVPNIQVEFGEGLGENHPDLMRDLAIIRGAGQIYFAATGEVHPKLKGKLTITKSASTGQIMVKVEQAKGETPINLFSNDIASDMREAEASAAKKKGTKLPH